MRDEMNEKKKKEKTFLHLHLTYEMLMHPHCELASTSQ